MLAKLGERPPERQVFQSENHDQTMEESREYQLSRLGLLKGRLPAEGLLRPALEVPLASLKTLTARYLEDCELCNKPSTITDKADGLRKFIWYLEEHRHEVAGERQVRGFLSYVKNAHLQPQGRWNKAGVADGVRFRRPVSRRTVEAYFVTVRHF